MNGAKETLARFVRDMEKSSEQAMALTPNKDYQVEPELAEPKPLKIQLQQMRGKAEEYHTPEYKDLIGKLTVTRKEFPKTKDVTARKQMAK